VIAEILGHNNIDVTGHYAQVSTRLMMDTYNAAHPHASRTTQVAEHARLERPAFNRHGPLAVDIVNPLSARHSSSDWRAERYNEGGLVKG
jgi:hypothetical protein